ncbi:MAG TPA: DUF4174 domain-containing protein [Opitutales bacterium]|nr:DUF4174 domain-containing protein [Opitutales bacterium]
MKRFLFISFLIMSACASADPNPLSPFRWDYRIILIAAPSEKTGELVSELKREQAAIDERHILWFVTDGASLATNYPQEVEKDFGQKLVDDYFDGVERVQVRLIGKDGGVKEKAEKLDLAALFARIDAMPMRRAEMKETN